MQNATCPPVTRSAGHRRTGMLRGDGVVHLCNRARTASTSPEPITGQPLRVVPQWPALCLA
jgi:hypothetical protein